MGVAVDFRGHHLGTNWGTFTGTTGERGTIGNP